MPDLNEQAIEEMGQKLRALQADGVQIVFRPNCVLWYATENGWRVAFAEINDPESFTPS